MSIYSTFYRRIFGAASQTEQLAAQPAEVKGSLLERLEVVLSRRHAIEQAYHADTARIDEQAPTFWLMGAMSGAAAVLAGGVLALTGFGAVAAVAVLGGAVVATGCFYREREISAAQHDMRSTVATVYTQQMAQAQTQLDDMSLTLATQSADVRSAFQAAVARHDQGLEAVRANAQEQCDMAAVRAAMTVAGAAGISCVLPPRRS